MAETEVIHLSSGTQLGCVRSVKIRFAEVPASLIPPEPVSLCNCLLSCAECARNPARSERGDK
jgi:hypothetical protein